MRALRRQSQGRGSDRRRRPGFAYASQGSAILIAEDNASDDADDNWNGGVLQFGFHGIADVTSLTLLDVADSGGPTGLLHADGAPLNSIDIPAGNDNGIRVVEVKSAGVARLTSTLADSGAGVDDICFTSPEDAECRGYAVSSDDLVNTNLVNTDPVTQNDTPDPADQMVVRRSDAPRQRRSLSAAMRPRDQRPSYSAGRFSMKATTPSLKSRVLPHCPCSFASSASWSSIVLSKDARITSFTRA